MARWARSRSDGECDADNDRCVDEKSSAKNEALEALTRLGGAWSLKPIVEGFHALSP